MNAPKFNPEITFGNLLTVIVIIFGVVSLWFGTISRVSANESAIMRAAAVNDRQDSDFKDFRTEFALSNRELVLQLRTLNETQSYMLGIMDRRMPDKNRAK